MKNKRIIASLVAALSSFASSLAVGSGNGGNVKIISKGGQANINSKLGDNKLDAPSRNKSRKSSGNKNFLGKKRPRSEGSTSPSGDRHGSKDKNSANGKQDKKPSKNSGAIGASKSLTGNKPVSLKSNLGKSPKSNTIIPNVPNGVTYGAGGVAGTTLTAGGIELVANMGLHRSIIDKIRNGITIQGVIDHIEKNLTFTTQEVEVNNQKKNVGLLVLDLKNGYKMYVNAYITLSKLNRISFGSRAYFIPVESGLTSEPYKCMLNGIVKPYDDLVCECENDISAKENIQSDNWSYAFECAWKLAYKLFDESENKKDELKNSVFYGVVFSEKQLGYLKKEIEKNIKILINAKDASVLRFKRSN